MIAAVLAAAQVALAGMPKQFTLICEDEVRSGHFFVAGGYAGPIETEPGSKTGFSVDIMRGRVVEFAPPGRYPESFSNISLVHGAIVFRDEENFHDELVRTSGGWRYRAMERNGDNAWTISGGPCRQIRYKAFK